MVRTHRTNQRALRERRPRREAAQGTVTAVARPRNAPRGNRQGVSHDSDRAAGPERATARRAEWRVSQASGASARRLREMVNSRPAPEGNEDLERGTKR